jgi:hypothetical protein
MRLKHRLLPLLALFSFLSVGRADDVSLRKQPQTSVGFRPVAQNAVHRLSVRNPFPGRSGQLTPATLVNFDVGRLMSLEPEYESVPVGSTSATFVVPSAGNCPFALSLAGTGPGSSLGWTFNQTSGTVNGTSSSSWFSCGSTVTIGSGRQRNGGSPSEIFAAIAFANRIADRANIVEGRSHGPPPERYSCFISFSSADEPLARKLVVHLREHGVRCWFAPDDLRIGESIRRSISKAIREHDRMLVLMSKNSVRSKWVESEVEIGFAEERRRGTDVLFPVRLDDEISTNEDGWASDVQLKKVGDLTDWADDARYEAGFARILADLVKCKKA